MAKKKAAAEGTGIRSRRQVSDQKVEERTGRDWSQWMGWLDRRGAKKLGHKGIVALLGTQGVGPWYQQMIAVVYEQERGLRAVHEKPTGFEITRTKTIAADGEEVYRAFSDARRRRHWLGGQGWTVRTHKPPERMRVEFEGGPSILEIRVSALAKSKSRVSVQQTRLANARAAERSKTFWQGRLLALKTYLED